MYRPRGFDRRECPEPPHLLLQQNRFQILNAQNQQNCTSPVLYKQTGNTNMDQGQSHNTNVNIIQGQGHNTNVNIMQTQGQGCSPSAQIIRCRRMLCQTQEFYYMFPSPRRSSISNHPSGCRTMAQRRLMHQRLDSSSTGNSNRFMIDNEENYMQNNMLPGNIFNNSHTNSSIDNNAICGKQQLVQEFESNDRLCSQVMNGGEQQTRQTMSQSRVALSDFINNNSIDIDQSFNGLDDHSYSRKNTDNFSYEDENHTNAAYYTNCQRDSSMERLKVLQTSSASDEGQRFQNSNVCPFQRNSYINSLRIARNSNGNNTVSTDRSEKQSALNSDVESKLINQHLRTKIEQQASLNHEVKSKLVKESTLLQRALRDLINKEKEKEKIQIEAAKNKKNFRIEGSTITMTTEAKQPDKKSQTIDKSKHLESVVDKTKSNILCSSTSSGQSVQCMNADKRNIPENEPMEKKNFAISANVPTVESKIIVDNAKMVTGKSRENENQNKATGHQQVDVKSSSECVIDGQVRTQTAPCTESDGQVRTQTTPSTESDGQVRIQTAQSAEASYNLALKQWQKQNLCKTKTSDLQKTNTDDPYHQTHQQLKTQNSGRNLEMDSSNKKNCDSCLEALEENSTRSENIHSANTKNSDPCLEALAQSSVRSMNIHSSLKKNCDPCLEAQKQNSARSMNIHSNAKNHDPRLEAQKQSSANSMNIHSNTKNYDPRLEACKQSSANSLKLHPNTKNCDPRLEAQKQNFANSMNIHSSSKKNCDPCLEAQKQNSANSMNIHLNTKNHDPRLEAQKQNSANSLNIHLNTKNHDPRLEAQKQNSGNSMNIHSNTKNYDPRLEACKQSSANSLKLHPNTKNCDPRLEAQKQNFANSMNIHSSNTKNCDPHLEAHKQSSANSMNIHLNTKNHDPRLEAQKQNSANSLEIHSNTKNYDPHLEAFKQSSANSLNIHSNTKNYDPHLEAHKQSSANSLNIHSNTKNCDPRLEAHKQNSARSMNIHINTKNCDPRLEASKQNSARSIYIHSNTKNCDPLHEACKQNSNISNDALNTNSFHQNAEICTTNNRSYSQSAPLLHDRKNVDCNQSLDKLQSINPECPRKNPCRENESSENSCQDRKEVSSKDTGFRQALVDVVKAMFDLRRNKHFEEKIIARNQGDKASNNDNKLDGQKLNQTISANKDDYNLVRQSRNQSNKLSIDEYKHARQTVKQQIKPNKAESKQVVETRIQAKSIDTYQDNSQNGRVKHMQCERSSNFLKTSPVLSKTVKHTKETNEKPTTLETTQSSDKPLPCNSNAINDRNIFTCVFDTDSTRTRCDNSDVTENTDLMDENKHLDEYRKTSDLLEKSYSCQTPDKLNKESNSLHTDKISDNCLFSSAENSEDDRLLPDEKDEKSVKENYEDEFEDKCLILQGDIPQSMSVSYNKERNCDSKGSNNITEKTGVHGNNNCKTPSPSKMSPKIQSTGKDFSFLELGYCPLALPLGCYAYEEDTDRDENNNDSPKRLDFDPDIVATNKHMRMLCDEKYNHDNTEILTPWVIRYLDEIPKPTIRKEFLDKMDLELNENEFNHHHILQASIASPEKDDSDGEDIETDCRESPRIIPLDSHYVKDTRKTHQIRSLLNSSLEDTLSDLNSIPVSDDTPLIIPSDSHYVKDTIKTHQTRSLLNSSLDDTLSDLNSIPVSDDECDWSLGESEDDSSTDNYSERVPGDYSDEVPGESDQNEDKTDCAVGRSNHSKKSLQSEFDPESSGNRTEVTDHNKDENHKHLFQRETLLLKDNSVDNKANNSKMDLSLSCKIQNENDLLQKEANFHEETGNNKEKYSIGEPSKKIDSKKRKDEISNIDKKSDNLKEDAGKGDNLMLPQGTTKLLKKKVVDTESSSTLSTKKTRTKKRFSPTENQLFQEAMNFLCSGKIKDNNEKIIDCFSNSTIRTRQKSSNIGKDVEQGEARKKKQESSSLVEKDIVHADNVKKKRCCKPLKVKELKEKQKNILDNLKSQKEIISLEKKQEDNGENCDSIEETKDNYKPKTKTTELNQEVTNASKDRKYLIEDTDKQDEDKLDHSSVVMPVSEQLKGFLERPEVSVDVLPSKQKDLPLKRQDISPEESEALTGLLTLGESHKSVETQTLYNTDSGTCSEKRNILNSSCEVESNRTILNNSCEVKSDRTIQNSSCEVKSDRTILNSSYEVKSDRTILNSSCEVKSDRTTQNSSCEVKSNRTILNNSCEVKSDRTIQNSSCEVKSDRTILNNSCEVKSDKINNNHSSDEILQKSELENEIDQRINKLLNDVRGKMLNGDKSEENGQDKGINKPRGNGLYHNKEEQKDNKKGKHEENCEFNKKDKQEQNGDVCKRLEELKNLDEQKDKQEQNLEDDKKDKELQNPEGHQMDKQEHNLVDDEKYNQEKILKGDQKNEKDKHEQNLKSDIRDGQEQNSKVEHHSLPFLIAAATENDRSVPIDTTVQSGSTEDQTVTASNHTQSPGSNEYLEHSDSDTIPLVEKTVVEEKTPGKWLIPILERLNIDISKGRLIVTKTAQKLCIKTGTLIKSTCSYSSQTSVVQGKEERNIDNCAIDMIAVGDKSDHLGNESQNHDELNIENVNSSITKSKKRKKGKNLRDNSMELRSQGTTNTKKWKKLKESDDMLVPRITRNRALQVSKNPTINLPSKKGNLKKKKTSGKKLNETDTICSEINNISKEDDIDESTESFCHKKSDSSNKNSKGKGTKRKLEFDGREQETKENTGESCDKMNENQMKNKPPETKKKKIPKCRKMLNKSSTLEERSTESIIPVAELPEQMNNLGCDAVTELDNQKKSENGKKQKVKKNIMKKSSNKPLKSLSTPKTKSLKKISGAKSKKKTMANGDKVCFRLVTEPSEQKIVRLKAEALKKLYATKICAYCKQTVPSRQFKHHVKIHHPYRCAKCGLLFSNKEERLGHRREKHSSHQYHCIICNKIFDEKWHYGHHIKSLVHRNNREIYRRAINIMKSCIGLDLGPASKDLMILEDSHTDSTQKSLVPMEQSVNLFCSTEDVTLSYHEPEVQHLLNELSDVKSVMLNLVKSNSDFSFGQFTSSGQSSFFDCQIGRQVTQNFISDTVYSSEDAQFNDLTPCSENASLISQNSLAIENNSSSSSSTLSFDDPSFRACLTSSSQQDSTGMPFDNPNFRACLTNVSQQDYTGMPFDNPSFRACLNNRSQQDSFGMPFENPNFRACLAKSSQQDRTGMPFENPSFRACPTITSQQDYTGMPFDDPNFRVCLTNTSQRDNTGMSIDDPSFRTGLSTNQANSTGLYFDDPNVRACLTANQPNSTGMSFDDPHFKACLTNTQPNSPGMTFDNPHFKTCLTNDTCFRACNTSEGQLQNDALSVGDPNLRSCQTKIRQPDIDKTAVISKTNGSPTNNDMLTDAFRLLEEEGYFENDQITSITSDIDLSEMVNNKEFTNLTRTPLVIEQKSYLPGEPIEQYPYLTGNQVEQNPNMPGIPEEQCPNLPGISEEQNPGMPGIPLEQYHNLSSIPVEKSQIDIINGNTESAENYSLLELSSHIPINAQQNIPMANFSDQQQHFNFDSNNNAVGQNVQHQIGHNSDKVQCQIEQNGNVQCQNIEQFKAQGQNVYEDERRNVQDEYLAISQEIAQEEGMEF